MLYVYYQSILSYINNPTNHIQLNQHNLCIDKNNANLPFFTDNLIYSSKGYPRELINDDEGKFYLIHPEEKDLKRDINGNMTEIKNKDYILYFEDYYVLRLISLFVVLSSTVFSFRIFRIFRVED